MDIKSVDKNMVAEGPTEDLVWFDADQFTVEGKGWENTNSFYERLPAKAEAIVNPRHWYLSQCPAGIVVRFKTNSPALAVQWDGNGSMEHMSAVGVSGVDLYVKNNDRWQWLAIGCPLKELNEAELFSGLPVEEREFMLYLPLYDKITTLKLGIPHGFSIIGDKEREDKPIIFYGTSITQGASASRPGMCYPAILGRWLDREVINLGFAGNGRMEPEIIDLLCELDPSIFVVDCLPNMQKPVVDERLETAIKKLRVAHPNTPIVLVDNMLYCDAHLKQDKMDRYKLSNQTQFSIYEKLVSGGIKHLYYVKDNNLIGADGEATVDGTHFTDLGYMRFSESLFDKLKTLLK